MGGGKKPISWHVLLEKRCQELDKGTNRRQRRALHSLEPEEPGSLMLPGSSGLAVGR
jgi:hypothetical protein